MDLVQHINVAKIHKLIYRCVFTRKNKIKRSRENQTGSPDGPEVVKLRTKLSVVTFIQEDFPANFLHHNIPRINGSSTTHQCSQNSVSGKNIGIRVAFG